MKKSSAGFTLIEILVVVGIIGILSAIIYASFGDARAQSRDAKRQADLKTLQAAIELYKNDNGRYPQRCAVTGKSFSGQKNTNFECNDGSGQYIVGLAPKYIPSLPTDPKLNGPDSGYAYTVNSDGTVYKIIVYQTVEKLIVSKKYGFIWKALPEMRGFMFCDKGGIGNEMCDGAETSSLIPGAAPGNIPNNCEPNDIQYRTSYAVWGGYANKPSPQIERYTEEVVCAVP